MVSGKNSDSGAEATEKKTEPSLSGHTGSEAEDQTDNDNDDDDILQEQSRATERGKVRRSSISKSISDTGRAWFTRRGVSIRG